MNELDNDEKDQLKKYLKNFAKRAFNSKNKEKLYDTNKLLFSFFNCEYSELLTLPKYQAIAPPTSDIYRAVKCTCTLCSQKEIQESTFGKKI